MIVPMQKVTLLCVAHDRAVTLETLRHLGVLHVKPVVPPAGAGLEQAREKAAGLRRLLEVIPVIDGTAAHGPGCLDRRGRNQRSAGCAKGTPVAARNIGIRSGADRAVRFVRSGRGEGPVGKGRDPETVPRFREIGAAPARGRDGRETRRAESRCLLGRCSRMGPFEWAGAEEQRLPDHSLARIQEEISRLRTALSEGEKELQTAAGDRSLLQDLLTHAEAEVKLQEVRGGMGASEAIAYVQGFVPVERCRFHPVRRRPARMGAGGRRARPAG